MGNHDPGDPLVELFFELARIASPSGRERQVVDFLTAIMVALGLEVDEDEPPQEDGGNAGNLYCHLEGSVEGTPVLFSAHTDTIVSESGDPPEPTIKNGVITSANRVVLGADDKAALAAIMNAIEQIIKDDIPHAGIELLFTVSEEKGLRGAKAASLEGVKAECGFCLDSTGPVGDVIVRSPTQKTIRATFTGRSAHAGVAPEEGRSAVVAASKAVTAMSLGRIDDETTANIGIIKGGDAINVVPERCIIAGECRSHNHAELERQVESIVGAINEAAAEEQVDVELSVVDEFHAFDIRDGNLPFDIAGRAIRAIGIEPEFTATGGGSDVNEFNRKGLPSVNLSVGMERVHSPEEYITAESLRQARDLILAIVAEARKP